MSCYNPIRAFRTSSGVVFQELSRYDIIGRLDLPCGMCIGCRMRRASDWELRIMHEASLHSDNCFITLTYSPGNLPAGCSLEHRDFQLFMKRLRRAFGPVRFYMCGEYGPLNLRPHYHVCLFGLNFMDRFLSGKSGAGAVFFSSPVLDYLWGLGSCTVQDLVSETASYCARYIMTKHLGEDADLSVERVDSDGVIYSVVPEYSAMSLKPGIGAGWFDKFGRDVYPHDFVVSRGVKRTPPKYYDVLFRRSGSVAVDQVEHAREVRARSAHADNTPERLSAREQVHLARVSKLSRSFDS